MKPINRIADAYRQMAADAKYRPAAPGDGWGGISLDRDQLADANILADESLRYAEKLLREEDGHQFWIGCSCFDTVRAFVYTIEAARCLCAGTDFENVAGKLLRMALAELEGKRHRRR